MEYLKAVLKESLRLHPPAPLLVPHESTAAAVVQGYEIPAKTALFINAWAIGRDPAAWGDAAKEFQPSGSSTAVAWRASTCGGTTTSSSLSAPVDGSAPAVAFALPALEIALASLVGHFDWELPIGTRLDMSEAPADHSAASSAAPPPQVQDTCLGSA
ncbi:cytochrome P450 71A1-like [Lolium perenne]|uniref:cytochrome P450 71A1-like n=1 Tax=Lolium perenne TaxID=4522 RepID=UPI003A99A61E